MSPGAEAKSFDELISSAAATVTGEDVAKAQESSTNMQRFIPGPLCPWAIRSCGASAAHPRPIW